MEISKAGYVAIYVKYGIYACLVCGFTCVKRRYIMCLLYVCLMQHFTCVKSLKARVMRVVGRPFT